MNNSKHCWSGQVFWVMEHVHSRKTLRPGLRSLADCSSLCLVQCTFDGMQDNIYVSLPSMHPPTAHLSSPNQHHHHFNLINCTSCLNLRYKLLADSLRWMVRNVPERLLVDNPLAVTSSPIQCWPICFLVPHGQGSRTYLSISFHVFLLFLT